jgi:hypothetical protein
MAIQLMLATGAELLIPLITGAATVGATALMRPKAPKPQEPARMPDPLSPEVQAERRRRVAAEQARSGRESTILSDDNAYSNNFLGE